MRTEKKKLSWEGADGNVTESKKGKVNGMYILKKIAKSSGTIALAIMLAWTGIQVPGMGNLNGDMNVMTAEAASTTDRLPLWCYMRNSSGVLYTYNNDNLTGQTGYIEPGDYCKILKIYSNGVVYVEYPTSHGKRQKYASADGFFVNVDFSNALGYAGQEFTVYKRSTGNSTMGTVFASDTLTILGNADGRTQVFYKLSDGSGFKCGWIPGEYSISDNNNNTKQITVFRQTDSRWKDKAYGKGPDGKTATLGTAGCGILSYVNAVYYMTGNMIEPSFLADWSVQNGYRINGVGTAYGLYKAFADNCGAKYGFRYIRSAANMKDIQGDLQNGKTAILGVKGHLIACVKYENGKYLILDSYPSSGRGTQSGYRWLTETQFTGKLKVSTIQVIGAR